MAIADQTDASRLAAAMAARRQIEDSAPAPALTKAEIKAMVLGMWDIAKALRSAAPDDKVDVYRELGIKIRYEPGDRVIIAQAGGTDACSTERVGGGT